MFSGFAVEFGFLMLCCRFVVFVLQLLCVGGLLLAPEFCFGFVAGQLRFVVISCLDLRVVGWLLCVGVVSGSFLWYGRGIVLAGLTGVVCGLLFLWVVCVVLRGGFPARVWWWLFVVGGCYADGFAIFGVFVC